MFISRLNQIVDKYDMWLFDIVGVVHDGLNPLNGAIETIRILQKNKKVLFLSNMPRPGSLSQGKLVKMGLQENTLVFTSGDAVRIDLQNKLASKKIYHWGAERNDDILAGLNVMVVDDLENADIVLLTQYIEQYESLEQFDPIIDTIVTKRIPVICANPDEVAMHGDALRYTAGTFATRVAQAGGHVDYYGKPNPRTYEIIEELYSQGNTAKDRMIMIGDTLETDIRGAQNYGIDSLLVMTGNTARDCAEANLNIETYLKNYQQQYSLAPTYVVDSLKL